MAAKLQDHLDQITARTRSLVQPERLAISERATADLFSTGIEDRVLHVGSAAPPFELEDSQNPSTPAKPVRSSDLLALGPLILKFFRGRWDPYCVTELEVWQGLYSRVREHGALLVAISPQTRRQNDFTAQQHGLSFPVLSDPGCRLADEFGLAHTLPEAARRYYRSILVNIPFANSGMNYDNAPDAAWRLPLPGLILIRRADHGGTVAFSEAYADPHVRPEPEDLLDLL